MIHTSVRQVGIGLFLNAVGDHCAQQGCACRCGRLTGGAEAGRLCACGGVRSRTFCTSAASGGLRWR